MAQKQFRCIEIKAGEETGTFTGRLSTYGKIDQGQDTVEPGAYTKTIADNKGEIALLWNHDPDQPIGIAEMEDREDGLWIKGRLLLGVQKAAEVYEFIKAGVAKSLSIGFKAMQQEKKDGVRFLKEIKLYEGSVVLWPMDLNANITSVKSMEDGTGDFAEEFDEAQTARSGCLALRVLEDGLTTAWWTIAYQGWGGEAPDPKVLANYASSFIDQFKTQFLASMDKYSAMMAGETDDVAKSIRLKAMAAEAELKAPKVVTVEQKVGKKISGDTADQMKKAVDHLTAISETAGNATKVLSALLEEPAAEGTGDSGAAAKTDEPDTDVVPLGLAWIAELKALNESFSK